MFFKDLFRLIKTSFNRFIFLFCIVVIGVGFLMGLSSTPSIMRESVNGLYNELNYRDLKVYSNFGFCNEDINAINKLDYVEEVEGSYERDAYVRFNGESYVARFAEINTHIDRFELVEGRLPINDNECLISSTHLFGLGISSKDILNKRIDAYLNDDDLDESLKNTSFIIVGTFETPEYMSKILSSSNLDNKKLDTIFLINNSNFISDYYSCLKIKFKNSSDYISFGKDYENLTNKYIDEFETFSDSQKEVCRTKIVNKALDEIKDAEDELATEEKKGKKELADALKEIKDGEQKIIDAENEIAINEPKLNDAKSNLDTQAVTVNNAISSMETSSGLSFNVIYQTVKDAHDDYVHLASSKISHIIDDRYWSVIGIPYSLSQYNDAVNGLPDAASAASVIATTNLAYEGFVDGVLSTYDTAYSPSLEDNFNSIKSLYDGKNAINNGYKEIEDGKRKIEDGRREIEENKKKIKDGYRDYYKGLKEFNEKIADAKKEIADAKKELDDLKDAKWIILDKSLDYSFALYKGSCDQMEKIGYIMPLLFFLVGILVCITTMTRLIQEQRTQIGIYRALGYSKNIVIIKYILYVLIASFVGSVVGVFVGMAIFPPVIYNTWRLLYTLPSMKVVYPFMDLCLSLFSFSIIMVIVTYFVVRDCLDERPSNLLRPKAPKSSKPILLEKIKIIWNQISFTGKVTFRNLFRYKARFFMTIIGVAGCTGLLVLGFGIKDSISDVVEIQYTDFYQHNYLVNLASDLKEDEIDSVIDTLDKDDSIDNISSVYEYSGKVFLNNKDSVINVEILSDDDFDRSFNLVNYKTDNLLKLRDDGVIITEKFAINNNLKEGDKILLESYDGETKEVIINDICKTYFQHYLFISSDLYKTLFNKELSPNVITIYSTNNINYLDKYVDHDKVVSITDYSSFIESFENMIISLDLIILVIILTAGSLAFVVLFNLIAVNIAERLREIATLKVLGFRKKEVHYYIFKELLLLSIIGGLLGLFIGRYEVLLVMNIINVENIMFPCNVKAMSYVYSFAITIAFTVIVLIFTRKTLDKVKMVESLKSVE